MKTYIRTIIFLSFITVCALSGKAQDTLHLYYQTTTTIPHDTTVAKLEKWAKSLKAKGQHVDVKIVAYFHKPEFRKYATERCDEMFLQINRKARDVITLKSNTPQKGESYQRSTVDIIYWPTGSDPDAKAAAAKKAVEEKEKQEKEAEKAKKEGDKPKKEGDKAKDESAKDDKKDKSKTDVAKEQTEKGDKKKDSGDKKGEKEEDEDDADYGQAVSRTVKWGSQSMNLEELKYVKGGKIVVTQSGNKAVDASLYKAVQEFWKFNPNVVQMPYGDAEKMCKANKKDTITLMSFGQVRVWNEEKYGPVTVKILRIAYAVFLENAKGKVLVFQLIPKDKGRVPNQVDFSFGVSFLNNLCQIMDKNNLSKSGKADPFYDLRAPELKQKNLYIAEHQVNKNLPREEIKTYYTNPLTVVTDKVWEDAILQRKDVAYVMVVLRPTSPKLFVHYIMDAKTGETYLIDWGSAGVSVGYKTFAPSQSGFVDKSNLERYMEGIADAEKDNVKRAEKKADKDGKEKEKAAKDADKEKEKAAKKEKEAEEKTAKEKEKLEKEEAKKKEKEQK
jgi:flagellar biosynthesis GTPase FlhF